MHIITDAQSLADALAADAATTEPNITVPREVYLSLACAFVRYGDSLNNIIRIAAEAERLGKPTVTYTIAELHQLADPALHFAPYAVEVLKRHRQAFNAISTPVIPAPTAPEDTK